MRSTTDSRINMLRTVAKLYGDEQPRFDVIPVFPSIFATYNGYLTEMDNWLAIALEDATLAAALAHKRKVQLSMDAEAVANHVLPYANAVGNEALSSVMNVRASKLEKEKKDRLPTICRTIFEAATKVKTPAIPYGLTQAELDQLEASITAYAEVANTPRLAHGEVSNANEEAMRMVSLAINLLNTQLDRLVLTLKATDAALVSLWFTARKIVNPRTNHTSFLITVLTDEATPVPVANAHSVVSNGKDYGAFTDASGKALFKPAPPGEVAVRVEAAGFQPYLLPNTKLKLGADNFLEVKLERAA
jgi:hypothetical protein